MLETIDPFSLKEKFDWFNFLAMEVGDLRQDLRFLRVVRRALLPIPGLDRRAAPEKPRFPPLKVEPHPVLAGKRVGLVTSGGSGALVSLCGVKRALEEAGIDAAAVAVCSGSAIWGSMIAAGLTAQEMVDFSFSLGPRDMVDPDWKQLRRIPLNAGRGFAGIARGEAIERAMDRALKGVTLARTKVPYYAIVLNIDTNEIDYFGPHNHPEIPLARMVRVAIALPLFIQPVQFGNHYYVDGGVVNIFPVEPLLRFEKPFDYLIGVNVIMPLGFRGEDITGWLDRPGSVITASRQLYHAQWLELARQQMEKAKGKMLLVEPLPYSEIVGSKFYEVFLDQGRWADFILRAYDATRERLRAFRG